MTRAGFLQSLAAVATAAISPKGEAVHAEASITAEEFVPEGKHFILSVPGALSLSAYEQLRRCCDEEFLGCKVTILSGGVRLEEVRPLGTADIASAVEAGVRRALEADRAEQEADRARITRELAEAEERKPLFFYDAFTQGIDAGRYRAAGYRLVEVRRAGKLRDKAAWQDCVDRLNREQRLPTTDIYA